MSGLPLEPFPPPSDTGGRIGRITILVVVALVVLCGLAGTCLSVVLFLLPVINGGSH